GSLVAGRFSNRVDADKLRQWFAYLVFAVAGYVLVDTLFLS
ncbi:MAG: sulfite exporter TauE/SafE family protein, partial [Rhodococcus sp. (in: high G+C Gram-positive bacteria)]